MKVIRAYTKSLVEKLFGLVHRQRQSWKAMAVDNQAMVISQERLLNCLYQLLVMRNVISLQ